MRRTLAIATLLAIGAGTLSAATVLPSVYTWKAMAGGFVDFSSQLPLDGERAYLFDGKAYSPNNLIKSAKCGASLADLPFVLAKPIIQGVISTGTSFQYDGEEPGVSWDAYMAVQLERDGKRFVYVSSAVDVMGTGTGLATTIAFESQGEMSGTLVETEAYSAPGWYEVGAVSLTICPGRGTDELEVSAASANAAVGLVTVVSPDAEAVSNVDYAKYFKLKATPLSEGHYLVRAELDETALELDKTMVSFAAALSDLAKRGGTTVTVEVECKPGLSYRVLSASAVGGGYEKGRTTPLTTGAKTEVEVVVPEGDKAFFRIGVEPRPEEEVAK